MNGTSSVIMTHTDTVPQLIVAGVTLLYCRSGDSLPENLGGMLDEDIVPEFFVQEGLEQTASSFDQQSLYFPLYQLVHDPVAHKSGWAPKRLPGR